MLRSQREFNLPELDAYHRSVELRSMGLRIGRDEQQTMMSDYALLDYADPFIHRMSRSALVIVLEGEARFEEQGQRVFVGESELLVTDQRRGGTEAYAPTSRATSPTSPLPTPKRSVFLFVDWDPAVFGCGFENFDSVRLTKIDRTRLEGFARDLTITEGDVAMKAAAEILAILRASGLSMTKVTESDLTAASSSSADDQRLMTALDAQLSNLELHPSFDEIAGDVGWSERQTNRRMVQLVKEHSIPWPQWRSMLHAARLVNAFRVLSIPGATTELAARKTGFRSASALCHALAKANLPSPGALAKACQSGRLDAWTSIVDRPRS